MGELATNALVNDANLLAYWRFEGNSNDSKGANNGTDAFITYSAGNGKFGQGAGFNGTTSLITMSNYASGGTNLTVSAWVKYATGVASAKVIYGQNLAGQAFWTVGQDPDGTSGKLGAVNFRGSEAGGTVTKLSTAGYADDLWHHLAVTWTGASGTVGVYVDGVSQGTATGGAHGDVLNSNSATLIGDGGGKWNGAIDDLAVFTRVLTPTEISSLFASQAAGGTAMLLGV